MSASSLQKGLIIQAKHGQFVFPVGHRIVVGKDITIEEMDKWMKTYPGSFVILSFDVDYLNQLKAKDVNDRVANRTIKNVTNKA